MQVRDNLQEESETTQIAHSFLNIISQQVQQLRNRLSILPNTQNRLNKQVENVNNNIIPIKNNQEEAKYGTIQKNSMNPRDQITENQPISDFDQSQASISKEQEMSSCNVIIKSFDASLSKHKWKDIEYMINHDQLVFYGKGQKFHLASCHHCSMKSQSCTIKFALYNLRKGFCKKCF